MLFPQSQRYSAHHLCLLSHQVLFLTLLPLQIEAGQALRGNSTCSKTWNPWCNLSKGKEYKRLRKQMQRAIHFAELMPSQQLSVCNNKQQYAWTRHFARHPRVSCRVGLNKAATNVDLHCIQHPGGWPRKSHRLLSRTPGTQSQNGVGHRGHQTMPKS